MTEIHLPERRPTPPPRTTRRPTGKPSWSILLLAGAEKAGKSWAAAVASGSDLVGRTLWIGVGEDDPDEYGAVPGADFEIIPHDGTFTDILAAIEWATSEPPAHGGPTLIVVDSMTRLWELLCDMAQQTATTRSARKNRPGSEPIVTMDLWNVAKDRWAKVMRLLRDHAGPVLLTARMDEVAVVIDGKPTTDKVMRIKAEKSLPYDVGGIVELPERGKAFLTGMRTTRIEVPGRVPMPGFTVDALWRRLGLGDKTTGAIGPRRYAEARVDVVETDADWLAEVQQDIATADTPDVLLALWGSVTEAANGGRRCSQDDKAALKARIGARRASLGVAE